MQKAKQMVRTHGGLDVILGIVGPRSGHLFENRNACLAIHDKAELPVARLDAIQASGGRARNRQRFLSLSFTVRFSHKLIVTSWSLPGPWRLQENVS
jgi:hypothetical protein